MDTFGHTTTEMGSGYRPDYGCGISAYHRNVMYFQLPQGDPRLKYSSPFEDASLEYITNSPETDPGVLPVGYNPPGINGVEAGLYYGLSEGAPGSDWGTHLFFGGNKTLYAPGPPGPRTKVTTAPICGPVYPPIQFIPPDLPTWWKLIPRWDNMRGQLGGSNEAGRVLSGTGSVSPALTALG
jgi:hypothetical protein